MTARPPRPPVTDGTGWHAAAACRDHDPEAWFPHDKSGASDYDRWAFARAVCATCPVTVACLDAALAEEPVYAKRYGMRGGMRGGLTPEQRARIARRDREAS